MRTQQKQRVETLGDLWGVEQHHWNTRAKETFSRTSVDNSVKLFFFFSLMNRGLL